MWVGRWGGLASPRWVLISSRARSRSRSVSSIPASASVTFPGMLLALWPAAVTAGLCALVAGKPGAAGAGEGYRHAAGDREGGGEGEQHPRHWPEPPGPPRGQGKGPGD